MHLEGSIEPETLREIDPMLLQAEIEANLKCGSFADSFRVTFGSARTRKARTLCPGDARFTGSLAAQNVTYAEITLSAGVVLWKRQDLAAVYDAVWRESQRSSIVTFWILDAIRHFGPENGMEVAEFAVEPRRRRHRIRASGAMRCEGRRSGFADVFASRAIAVCVWCVMPGETAGPGIRVVRVAIWSGTHRAWNLGGRRIPALMAVCERTTSAGGLHLEQRLHGRVPSLEAHPVRQLYEAGVPITMNTDDPAFFQTT